MRDANFVSVFVGIESPDTGTLVSAQKKQNTRRSLADSVHKIYRAGMYVHAGFIVGFDSEKQGTAEAMIECVEATSVPVCMVGLLYALPNTQLERRLEREGRLFPSSYNSEMFELGGGDQCVLGLNFQTARPRGEILLDLKQILQQVYNPDAFFDRAREMARMLDRPKLDKRRSTEMAQRIFDVQHVDLVAAGRICWRVFRRQPRLLRHFFGALLETARKNPRALDCVFTMTLMYFHLGPFAAHVASVLERRLATLPAGERSALSLPIGVRAEELAAAGSP